MGWPGGGQERMIMKKHTHNHDDTQKHPTSISLVNDILLQQNHSGLIRQNLYTKIKKHILQLILDQRQ